MVYINTVLESLVVVCQSSDALSEHVTYATVEPDRQGAHSNVSLPLIEFIPESVERDTSRNTEYVGPECDEDGNQIGYKHQTWFTADVHAYVQSVDQSSHNHREIEQSLRDTLSLYDVRAGRTYKQYLPDPDNPTETLDGVNWLQLDGWERNSEFSMSPSLRTRDVQMDIAFQHTLCTSELGLEVDHIEDIDVTVDVVTEDGSLEQAFPAS
jgi:hypothetical protein